jgi:hypothetical protein
VKARLLNTWDLLRASFWFLPALKAGGAEGASSVLSTIAGLTITIAGVETARGELLFKRPLWLALQEAGHVLLSTSVDPGAGDPVPDLFPPRGMCRRLLGDSGLALVAAPGDNQPAAEGDPLADTFPLHVRSCGPDQAVAARLVQRLQAWDAAGRPAAAGALCVWALPAAESPDALPADATLTRRGRQFGIRWGSPS